MERREAEGGRGGGKRRSGGKWQRQGLDGAG